MKLICFGALAAFCCAVSLCREATASAANESDKVTQPLEVARRKDVSEEMQLINKSLEGLMNELAAIKREATGRLSQVRKGNLALPISQNDLEQIRQQKVSRFVLKRVAELETESLGMRNEMAKLFELSKKADAQLEPKSGDVSRFQEDHDFDDEPTAPATSTTQQGMPSSSAPDSTTTTTTLKPEEEAAQIGFDLEQLKKLGNELESEIEARQAQNPQSLRGIHEQIVRMTNQMVQNYLASVRRIVHRFNNLVERIGGPNQQGNQLQPRESTVANGGGQIGESLVGQLKELNKGFRDFALQWSRAVGKQQSPLIDRIPPRGVELWRDFWDTVRKQIRRINNEFLQLSRDMGRVLTGRRPANQDGATIVVRPRDQDQSGSADATAPLASLLYFAQPTSTGAAANDVEPTRAAVEKQFREFYDRLSAQLENEQKKMDAISKASGGQQQQNDKLTSENLIEELDDEQTRLALTQNPGLRQQINQDINVFSSIFDIIRTFLSRLRGSAEDIRNILERPGAPRDNNPVTPGPDVKPTVDQLLKDTVDSQRSINSQARPAGR